MIFRILFPALGLIALVFYLAEKTRRYTLKAVFLKTLVSILFVALGVCGAYRALIGSRAILAPFVVTGLFFGSRIAPIPWRASARSGLGTSCI